MKLILYPFILSSFNCVFSSCSCEKEQYALVCDENSIADEISPKACGFPIKEWRLENVDTCIKNAVDRLPDLRKIFVSLSKTACDCLRPSPALCCARNVTVFGCPDADCSAIICPRDSRQPMEIWQIVLICILACCIILIILRCSYRRWNFNSASAVLRLAAERNRRAYDLRDFGRDPRLHEGIASDPLPCTTRARNFIFQSFARCRFSVKAFACHMSLMLASALRSPVTFWPPTSSLQHVAFSGVNFYFFIKYFLISALKFAN